MPIKHIAVQTDVANTQDDTVAHQLEGRTSELLLTRQQLDTSEAELANSSQQMQQLQAENQRLVLLAATQKTELTQDAEHQAVELARSQQLSASLTAQLGAAELSHFVSRSELQLAQQTMAQQKEAAEQSVAELQHSLEAASAQTAVAQQLNAQLQASFSSVYQLLAAQHGGSVTDGSVTDEYTAALSTGSVLQLAQLVLTSHAVQVKQAEQSSANAIQVLKDAHDAEAVLLR